MSFLILLIFLLGYGMIIAEHALRIDKAATSLITGVLCWVAYMTQGGDSHQIESQLVEQIGEIAGILFFLIGAMTIVELIDLYDGFQVIIDRITTNKKRTLLVIITLLSFFLSAVLDNLTTAIVMTSLILKLVTEKQDRLLLIGMVIIAANAGGAWSPLGDVTTTMLWVGGQIKTTGVIQNVFLPSLVSVLIPMLVIAFRLNGNFEKPQLPVQSKSSDKERRLIFISGMLMLLFVPVFKTLTHLPPFMGMMLAVGLLWVLSEFLHKKNRQSEEERSSIFSALERIDMPSILFFMGILMAVGALQSAGILNTMALWMNDHLGSEKTIVTSIGLLSAVFDNVPLVAAVQGMYPLSEYAQGHFFWNYLAYCAGTGGSILIIGSAAGVAAMGMEKISFFWYLKNISLLALLGYLAGALIAVWMH